MIELKDEDEMMVWLLAMNGQASNAYSGPDTVRIAEFADKMVEEFRKRIKKEEI